MRIWNFNGTGKAAVVSGVVTFTQSDIGASAGIVYLVGAIGGTGNGRFLGPGGVERLVVKQNGNPIYDLNYKSHFAYTKRNSLANVSPYMGEEIASATYAAAISEFFSRNQQFIIPLNFFDLEGEQYADECQFPPASQITVELYCGSTITTSATIYLGWAVTTIRPKCFPMVINSYLNIAASASVQNFAMSQPGIYRGIIIPRLGLTRLKLTVANGMIFQMRGSNTVVAPSGAVIGYFDEGDMIAASQMLEGGEVPFFNAAGSEELRILNPSPHHCIMQDTGQQISLGGSNIEVDTGSNWATAQPDNTVGIISYIKLG